ncbi:hypothetical protein BBK36DRAFT_68 [Trichoderma citrinoviride]|uniref:Transcription factor domain-containing protein n=1 Tax=Trichoderma citrinoviride TaxID=58853 RepID=A0A2T4BLQ4_9HYPO|nr:hypothetical protein BBK36DRAFT_68 [Trichoderma citrinoviride]PTB70189.1 hypothetical protein BBK36DRAFT_68 [Trichoderma citrinoviride]
MGLKCPGARTDAFFVYTVVDASAAFASLNSKHEPSLLRSGTNNRHPVQLPASQPSPAGAFDQLFVSHFIDSFFGTPRPSLPVPGGSSRIWLHELPEFLASPSPSPVQSSIRAASMLSYGTAVGDASLKTEACRWYLRALQSLRLLLSHDGPLRSSSESLVCAAVMLVHFETLAGTSPRAWLKHVKGAASLLEGQGPERCRTGFLHQIFSHLRLQTFVAAMANNELHPFASPQWTTIPFETHPKLIFDRLVDILFAAQRCLSIASRLITSKTEQRNLLCHELNLVIQDARLQIHQWRSEALSYASRKDGRQNQEASEPVADDHLMTSSDPFHFMLPYNDVASAALVTLYDAANVILLRLLCLVSPEAASYTMRVQQHSESILSAHAMIKTSSTSVPGRSSIMLVQQLKTVALWSPSSRQREVAVQMLQGQTNQNRGFADISAPSNEYFAHVAAYILNNYSVD